jgi:ribonuclease P protein subunit POP4
MMKGNNYTINAENIRAHELIGLEVAIIKSTAQERVGTEGIVMDETMKTITIKTSNGIKVVPKAECVFEFNINEKVMINGKEIMKRPENRVKEWRN